MGMHVPLAYGVVKVVAGNHGRWTRGCPGKDEYSLESSYMKI